MATISIRAATAADVPAILGITNEIIAHSTAIYALEPSSLAQRLAWFTDRTAGGYPVLVAAQGDDVIGFASFGEFRGAWQGYRYSVEHSVHVRADRRGLGTGTALVQALFPLAAAMGKHVMLGAIDAANSGSLRLHERLGFVPVAHFREVGHKFGRWLDLVFLQRYVDVPGAPRTDPAQGRAA